MSTAALLYKLPDEKQANQIAEERKADAHTRWEKIKSAGLLESTSSLTIGFHACYLKKNGLFGLLGFESEGQALKASGVGKSTWFECIRLAEAFDGITEEQFTSMKLGNAKAACDLPDSKRKSREWIRQAGIDEIDVFQLKVDQELEGRAKASDGKEAGVTLKLSMPLSRKAVVEQGLIEYAAKVGIENGDTGKALEMLIVEKQGETTLISSITNAVQRIKEAKALRNSYLSAEECLDRVMTILDDMVLQFADALKTVSAEESVQ